MKRLILLFAAAFFTVAFSTVRAGSYQIDDKALDQIFSNALTISMSDLGAVSLPGVSDVNSPAFAMDKDPLVAILLNLFVGYLGIHRFYLGTELLTGLAYIITVGGCGIVWVVDFFVLVINYDDISPYIDNPKFFMW